MGSGLAREIISLSALEQRKSAFVCNRFIRRTNVPYLLGFLPAPGDDQQQKRCQWRDPQRHPDHVAELDSPANLC